MWDPVEHVTLTYPLEIMLTRLFCKSRLYIGTALEIPHPCTNACAKSVVAIMVEMQVQTTVCIFNTQCLFHSNLSW